MNRRKLIAAMVSCVLGTFATVRADRKYVDANVAGGANDGSSWANAYTNLQEALAATGSGTNLWIAQGAYYPGPDRTNTFWLDNVSLYGGFTNGMVGLDQRDWTLHETILSGDVGTPNVTSDNSYHVVTWTNNVLLDGFTVAYGNGTYGSAVYNAISESSGSWLPNSTGTLLNCTFRNNSDTDGYGGALSGRSATLFVSNCIFRANSKNGMGNRCYAKSTIQDSRFIGNGRHGLCVDRESGSLVTNCVFVANTQFGLFHYYRGSGLEVTGCIFSGNGWQGYANTQTYATGRLTDSLIAGNGGGLVFTTLRDTPVIQNCIIAGNTRDYGGGCTMDANCHPAFRNCTFAANHATVKGGGLYASDSATLTTTPRMNNCIFWNNTAVSGGGELFITNVNTGRARMSYTDIEGGLPGAKVVGEVTNLGGNIDADPLFAPAVTGTWSANAVWDATTGQTVLTHDGAGWAPGRVIKLFLNPATTQVQQFVIATNSATTITIWGDASSIAALGDAYAIHDYHLRSKAGRWTTGGVWVSDAVTSPCIDAGDPDSVWLMEPEPNGARINIGAYGNTPQASKTHTTLAGTLLTIH